MFYKNLSKYYTDIFPFSKDTYGFLKSYADGMPVLDIGSAAGEYVSAFRQDGYDITGLEYEPMLIRDSRDITVGDMHSLPFEDNSFGMAFCIGNTIVHTESYDSLVRIFKEAKRVLRNGGVFIIQTVNYDRIMKNKPEGLGDIVRENVRFERPYEYRHDGRIDFYGVIHAEGQKFESRVTLYPVSKEELEKASAEAGFDSIDFYGWFDRSELNDETAGLVAVVK